MANWDKLNERFNQTIDNMSAADWKVWVDNRKSRKDMRRLRMKSEAKLKIEKIFVSKK